MFKCYNKSIQLPPFSQGIPKFSRISLALALRFPLAQHTMMGVCRERISSMRCGISCNGILILPSTCPPANSCGVRTSIMVNVSMFYFCFYILFVFAFLFVFALKQLRSYASDHGTIQGAVYRM